MNEKDKEERRREETWKRCHSEGWDAVKSAPPEMPINPYPEEQRLEHEAWRDGAVGAGIVWNYPEGKLYARKDRRDYTT